MKAFEDKVGAGQPSGRYWLALVPAMTLPLLGALIYFDWFSAESWARAVYVATKTFTLLWPLIAIRLLLREPWPSLPRDRVHLLRSLPLGLLTGVAIAALMFGTLASPLGAIVRGSTESIEVKARELGVLEHYWLFGIFIACVHSLLEEYYWRWFVFGRLRQVVPLWAAHLLAGLAFSAHHIVVTTQYFGLRWGWAFGLCVGVGGMLWSWQYQRQNTLAGIWVSHVIVDLAIFAIGAELIF